jgi:flagellar FliJ protein
MSTPFPLKPLLDLTQTRMDEAARRLGELIASERESASKLELLQNYRAEYQQRFEEAARSGIGPEAWRNFSAFLGRIDEAIEVQLNSVDQSKRLTSAGQQAWLAQRNKVKAFGTLQQRHEAGEAKKLARQEQRALDEHSAKHHRDRAEPDEA